MDIKSLSTSISPFKSDIINFLNGAKDEYINFFETGVSNYIEDRKSKFSITNTFLFPDEKVNFYDVYYPLSLDTRNSQNVIKSDELYSHLFTKTNCAGIFGIAGSGKTMLMKHIFLQCYMLLFKIPIFIELRDLNNNNYSFSEYIYKIILKNKLKPNTRILSRALSSGRFIFLLDGFDEINFDIKERVTRELEEFIDIYHDNFFLFSSRPGTSLENFPRLKVFYVNPLSKDEIIAFINIQLKKIGDVALISKLLDSINKEENKSYTDYLSNPLLLSMYILTFRNYPELPRSKNKFYWNVFDTLCTKHDSVTKKGGYIHDKKSKLQNEDFEKILQCFCYISLFENQYNFDKQYLTDKLKFIKENLKLNYNINDVIYDLKVSISILVEEGDLYKFPHRTMQDYFAVLFISHSNEIAKKNIYLEKIEKYIHIPTSQSFFDLCLELDKEAYYEHFLIPSISKLNKKYKSTSTNASVLKFVQDIGVEYHIKREKNKYGFIFMVGRRVSYTSNFIFLFGKNVYEIFRIKEQQIKQSSFISDFDNKYKLPVSDIQNDSVGIILANQKKQAILDFIVHFKIYNEIKEFFEFMNKKEKELRQELQELKSNNLAIWDFS